MEVPSTYKDLAKMARTLVLVPQNCKNVSPTHFQNACRGSQRDEVVTNPWEILVGAFVPLWCLISEGRQIHEVHPLCANDGNHVHFSPLE